MPLTPNNREEYWLQGMVDGSTDLTPNNRREHWYKEIVDAIGSGGGSGGGGVLVVGMDMQTMTLNKTWNELKSSALALISMENESSKSILFVQELSVSEGEENYYVEAFQITFEDTPIVSAYEFVANSADGYPGMNMG